MDLTKIIPGSSVKRNAIATIVLALTVFALYFNTLHNWFVWDDAYQVQMNPWIRSVKFIPDILARNVWGIKNASSSFYRPGMYLGYMLVYHLFGWRPLGYHVLNIIFNAGVSIVVFFLILELFESSGISARRALGISFLTALLFAANPIHTEAVAWIAAFTEVSYALFYLISLYFFILWRKEKLKAGIYFSCLFFVLSFMCKETALSLPLAIAAYEIAFPEGSPVKRRLKNLLPYFLLTVAYFVLRLKIAGVTNATLKTDFHLTNFQFALNSIRNFGLYLGQLIYPFNLNAYHVFHPVHSIIEWKCLASIAVLAAFTGFVFWAFKNNRPVFFGLLMILIPLLPALYLPVFQPGSTYAERYLYLPSMGFELVLASLVYSGRTRKGQFAALAFTALLIATFSAKTVARNTVWKDSTSLWTDTIRKSPDGGVPNDNFGYVLEQEGKDADAADYFRKAIKIAPYAPDPIKQLGYILINQGKIDEAENLFKKFILAAPFNADAHLGLGATYAMKGMANQAEAEFRVAAELNPMSWQAHRDLGILYYQKHLLAAALKELNLAVYIDPRSGEPHRYTGLVYEEQGLFDKAIRQFQSAIKLDPPDPEDYVCLGGAYLKKGLRDKAEESYRAALKIDPSNPEALKNLKSLSAKK